MHARALAARAASAVAWCGWNAGSAIDSGINCCAHIYTKSWFSVSPVGKPFWGEATGVFVEVVLQIGGLLMALIGLVGMEPT